MSWVIKASPHLSIFDPLREPTKPKVGDRVRMTQQGINNWNNQSGGGLGTVVAPTTTTNYNGGPQWDYMVEWDNGNTKLYHVGDVEVVQ